MPDVDGLLSFEEFRAAVGYPEHRVRGALFALDLQPVRSRVDQRRTYYRPEWVERVKGRIEGRGEQTSE